MVITIIVIIRKVMPVFYKSSFYLYVFSYYAKYVFVIDFFNKIKQRRITVSYVQKLIFMFMMCNKIGTINNLIISSKVV